MGISTVKVLELQRDYLGFKDPLCPTLIFDEEHVILIDVPDTNQFILLSKELENVGLSIEDLTMVLITHRDFDHIGCLQQIVKANPDVVVKAHIDDVPYIVGEKREFKLGKERFINVMNSLGSNHQKLKDEMEDFLINPPGGPVHEILTDCDVIEACGGITVIHTPGHTEGHLCFYLNASKMLVVGDALMSEKGELVAPLKETTIDYPQSIESIGKLGELDVASIICYHGGEITENCNEKLEKLYRELKQNLVNH